MSDEPRDRVKQALADYFDENAPAWWSENTADAIMPVIEQLCWEKAAHELRLAADDYVTTHGLSSRRTAEWLRDRAGVMDGGERR